MRLIKKALEDDIARLMWSARLAFGCTPGRAGGWDLSTEKIKKTRRILGLMEYSSLQKSPRYHCTISC